MLFRDQKSGVIAISQLTHAWISGQLLRAWDEALLEPLLLAAEQHDLGWIDWEVARIYSATSARLRMRRCGRQASIGRSPAGACMWRC
jgi:hypothetical protein